MLSKGRGSWGRLWQLLGPPSVVRPCCVPLCPPFSSPFQLLPITVYAGRLQGYVYVGVPPLYKLEVGRKSQVRRASCPN